jgi:hypothetical protein
MTAKENATLLGVGAAACAACCAGPILGVLAAIGLGTAAGFLLVGSLAFLLCAAAIAVVVLRRRRAIPCAPIAGTPVPIELSDTPGRTVNR